MQPCPHCDCHVFPTDLVCPHCGGATSAPRRLGAPSVAAVVLSLSLAGAGCPPVVPKTNNTNVDYGVSTYSPPPEETGDTSDTGD